MANMTYWAELAVQGILSPKERESARQELLDHMEDHKAALIRAGKSPWEAERTAVSSMGDPLEVGKLLRKVHQPVLTRLLQLARRATVLLAILFLWNAVLFSDWTPRLGWLQELFAKPESPAMSFQTDPLPEGVSWRMLVTPKASVPAGDYTASVGRIAITAPSETRHYWYVAMELQFRPRWFWQPDATPFYDFTLRSQDWECRSGLDEDPYDLYVTNDGKVLYIGGPFPTLPEKLELEYWGPQNRFTLPIDLSGGVIYEK